MWATTSRSGDRRRTHSSSQRISAPTHRPGCRWSWPSWPRRSAARARAGRSRATRPGRSFFERVGSTDRVSPAHVLAWTHGIGASGREPAFGDGPRGPARPAAAARAASPGSTSPGGGPGVPVAAPMTVPMAESVGRPLVRIGPELGRDLELHQHLGQGLHRGPQEVMAGSCHLSDTSSADRYLAYSGSSEVRRSRSTLRSVVFAMGGIARRGPRGCHQD